MPAGWNYARFGPQELHLYDASPDIGTGPVVDGWFDVLNGGGFNTQAGQRGQSASRQIGVKGLLLPPLTDRTAAALAASWRTLCEYKGLTAQLWRRWQDGRAEWVWAELMEAKSTPGPDDVMSLPVELVWKTGDLAWHGGEHGRRGLIGSATTSPVGSGWVIGTGRRLGAVGAQTVSNGGTVTLRNGPGAIGTPMTTPGIVEVRDAVLLFQANGTATLTSLTVTPLNQGLGFGLGYPSFRWHAGTWAPSSVLQVDTGAGVVLMGAAGQIDATTGLLGAGYGVDDWPNFTAPLTQAEILILAPGDNPLQLDWTGTATAVTMQPYYWEANV
jgi:hypothetical protein